MDNNDMSSSQVDRRRRRRQKRIDEESIDSVSTISKIVDDQDANMAAGDTEVKTKKKKLKKIKESTSKEDSTDADAKPRKRKKKVKQTESISSTEEFPATEKKHKKKTRDRRKITGSQALLKEDFYSDPQLATTLQGLEDDMYSVAGDADTSILSPYPLIPSIPSSTPVAKIYLEKNGGFSKTSVSAPIVTTTTGTNAPDYGSMQMSPLELGLVTQKVFRSLSTFCHGFLAGLASWQVFTIYILHHDDLQFVDLYSPLSQPLMISFYLLTVICTVSVCDRYDIAEFSLAHLRQCVTLQSGGVTLLVYWATLLLTLVTSKVDDKLSLYQHNNSLWEDMEPHQLSHQLETWKAMNLARSIAVVLGWFLVSLRPSTDLLYKHLKKLNSSEKMKHTGSRIEIVKMA